MRRSIFGAVHKLLAAARDRRRRRKHPRPVEAAAEEVRAGVTTRVAAPVRHAGDDFELERLEAEARYHRDRYDLYRARVISGSAAPTTPGRLRELERAATAARERLAHARRDRPGRS